jgi:hypothetical protein
VVPGTLDTMHDTLEWVRGRLEQLVAARDRGWSYAEHVEYRDLCAAEVWLLGREEHSVA